MTHEKGIVEAGVKYIKGSFLPLREFRDLDDANRQLQSWVMNEAGNRIHGTTREAPLKRFAEVEKGLLNALPSVPPELASWAKVLVHRDAHVQYETNYYSVPFRLIGCDLWLRATDTMVTLYREHEAVASHVRLTGKGLRDTVTDHMPPEAQAWQMQNTQAPDWRLLVRAQTITARPATRWSKPSWRRDWISSRRSQPSTHLPPHTPKAVDSAATPNPFFNEADHAYNSRTNIPAQTTVPVRHS